MINALFILVFFAASFVLLLLIWSLGAWMMGAPSILLPGLGLVVSMSFCFMLFLTIEIALILISAFLYRFVNFSGSPLGLK
jgi:hypothetical protein